MMEKFSFKIDGSLFWVIFWAIFFFPIALLLIFLNGEFSSTDHRYFVDYNGSTFWLCVWMIVFFPIAILLVMFNGLTLCKESKTIAA